jgi:hypothetical protein
LHQIENADPNNPEFDEDNINGSWGHRQFTSGGMRISTVLRSWDQIGSMAACKLIAAALKTCKVARFMCSERNISATSYLADVYLKETVEALLTAKAVAMENDVSFYFIPQTKANQIFSRLKLRPPFPLAPQLNPLLYHCKMRLQWPLYKRPLRHPP